MKVNYVFFEVGRPKDTNVSTSQFRPKLTNRRGGGRNSRKWDGGREGGRRKRRVGKEGRREGRVEREGGGKEEWEEEERRERGEGLARSSKALRNTQRRCTTSGMREGGNAGHGVSMRFIAALA